MASAKQLGLFSDIMNGKFNSHGPIHCKPQVAARMSFEQKGGANTADAYGHYETNAREIYYTYPLKLMLPKYASSSNCQWIYSINYGGGIVSGDNVAVQMTVKDQCCAMLTTQASTKIYHSEAGMTSQQKLEGTVESGSVLAVLQDPVLCYASARYNQTQTFHVSEGGNLVFMDWLSAGRIARGERWDFTSYTSCNSVFYKDAIIYRDAIHLESTPLLTIRETMQRYNVIASCVLVGPDFTQISQSILSTYGGMMDHGVKPNANILIAVSPVEKTVDGKVVPGVIMKFASAAVSEVYKTVEEILNPLFPMLGGNPFEGKH